MAKEKVDAYICKDGILIHERNTNQMSIWYESLDDIKIIKTKRKIEEIIALL